MTLKTNPTLKVRGDGQHSASVILPRPFKDAKTQSSGPGAPTMVNINRLRRIESDCSAVLVTNRAMSMVAEGIRIAERQLERNSRERND